MRSGPSEQLRPTESGLMCSTAFQKASMVCAEIMVSPPRPTAAEIMTGSSVLRGEAVLIEDFADGDERGLGVERVEDGFDEQQIDAAGDERAHLLGVGGLDLVEGDDAEAGVVGVGRVGERDGERPDGAGDEALTAGRVADAVGPLAALAGRLLVDLPGEGVEERIVDDLLVEGGIFAAAALAGIVDEELALGDAGGAEGVGLDDVRAGLKKAAVDVADHLWLREGEEIAVVEQVLRRVLEALAANVGFRHAVGADGGAHRSIDDGDAALENLLQRMLVSFCHHGSIKRCWPKLRAWGR